MRLGKAYFVPISGTLMMLAGCAGGGLFNRPGERVYILAW